MTRKLVLMLVFASLILAGCQTTPGRKATSKAGQWQSLFDGKTLDGWRASENKGTFTVRDGMIIAHGPRSHLFYVGPVNDANFTNFEFRADVMTTRGSNSGIYFHTAYQETGWPDKGFECQVNTTHSDPKKTGGLYSVQDVMNNAPSTITSESKVSTSLSRSTARPLRHGRSPKTGRHPRVCQAEKSAKEPSPCRATTPRVLYITRI